MNNGDTIKWTSTDESGKFSHVGKIEKINDTWVDFRVKGAGLMQVRLSDGTFEIVQESTASSLDNLESDAPTTTVTPPSTAKVGSKLERAIALYKAHGDKSNVEIRAMFVAELGMTPAGAATYYFNVKKMYNNSIK